MRKVSEQIGILIPALDPDQRLIDLLQQLIATGKFSQRIVVVDDGSQSQTIFNVIGQTMQRDVTILHHARNEGKGAALKTGFSYFIRQQQDLVGIATLDADGQHTVSDLQNCVHQFELHPQDMVLGCRAFAKDIPLRSRFGNTLTNALVRVLTHLPITDTQTGLRVIPISYAQASLAFADQRYAFEFDMLLQAKAHHVGIVQQPIQTIYLDNNAGSHFRVLRDSLAIYARFFKFAFSGFISFLIDIGIFALLIHTFSSASLASVMTATISARLVSAIANYLINHHLVFAGKGEAALIKYVALMVVQMLLSATCTHLIGAAATAIGHQTLVLTGIKMVVDFLLFIVSYQIQKRWVFNQRGAD